MVTEKYPEWFENNKTKYWPDIGKKLWDNFEWQLKNRVTKIEDLKRFLPDIESDRLEQVNDVFHFGITPYFLSLINLNNIDDPLLKQVLPNINELKSESDYSLDPFDEKNKSPVYGVIKRYPDRIVITTTNQCASYCRYCTRKWIWNENIILNKKNIDDICDYLKKNNKIREVIVSGGEPFLLSPNLLEYLLSNILSLVNIEVIRIGTRILSFLPQKINDKITEILKKYKPIWIITHFNHPNEITPATENAITRLIKSGVAICNQSVLLKGVNDNIYIMKKLLHTLQRNYVKPYYLCQCDLIDGTEHFRVSLKNGLDLIYKLHGNTGGICIPTFVIDTPQGGKIPILPDYILKTDSNTITFKNYKQEIYQYPNTNPSFLKK
jgi:lysine 2,3-aminomutase